MTDTDQRLDIPGPAGSLEAVLTGSATGARLAVLCHPHPQYGGSMDDLVLACLARVLRSRQIGCLRFNFRGVGGSAGSFSGSGGEVDDLSAVLDWARTELDPAGLIVCGYSFGASIVSQLMADSGAEQVLLIAPPIGRLSVDTSPFPGRLDIFAGDADDFVDVTRLAQWPDANIHLIEGADHFFSACQQRLEDEILAALS